MEKQSRIVAPSSEMEYLNLNLHSPELFVLVVVIIIITASIGDRLFSGRELTDSNHALPFADVHVSDLLTNHSLRNRSSVIFGCWWITFAIFFSLNTSEVMRTSWVPRSSLLALRIIELPFNVYVLRRIGRRLSLAYSMAALSVIIGCLAVVHVYRGSYALHWGVTVLWLLVFELTVTTLFAFSAELYPTVVRGAAVGLCYVSGRMGAIVGPFLNDVPSAELRGVAFSAVALLLMFPRVPGCLPARDDEAPASEHHGRHDGRQVEAALTAQVGPQPQG
ncbi:hypothetical protein HPB48_019533 [Haemaphysalis longicornis]|uniref:Uncharacterized protein n=1 Tax=Haemaphysalis longicornis TaxID=44386 RepID=A0A9J6GTU5_HAELO|nr:hypothetical protein HPB48_019533 [Haemaphysalis longicornis]